MRQILSVSAICEDKILCSRDLSIQNIEVLTYLPLQTYLLTATSNMDSFIGHFEPSSDLSNIPSSSNTSGLFPSMAFNQTMFERQGVQVEKLQMNDLMKNPLVHKMVTEAIDNATYQKQLFKQMSALQDEVLSLKEELAQKGTKPT